MMSETAGLSDIAPKSSAVEQREELERIVRADANLMQLLRVARELDLPQWRVVAGCIYQTVWNVLTSRPQGTGINDYDVIYFDAADLSEEGEDVVERLMQNRLPGLPARIEVRNQARVHYGSNRVLPNKPTHERKAARAKSIWPQVTVVPW